MSVLPNDISWLRCWLQLNILGQKLSEALWKDFLFDLLIQKNCSVVSFFGLEGGEY